MPQRDHNLNYMKPYRRELRNHSTVAEMGLWKWLKGRQVEGLLFRRQFSVGNYILDSIVLSCIWPSNLTAKCTTTPSRRTNSAAKCCWNSMVSGSYGLKTTGCLTTYRGYLMQSKKRKSNT